MVTIHLAYTAPVNPPGAKPVLTQAQVFAGFQRKVRKPWEFVPAIDSAEVVSDEGNVVTRLVKFKSGGSHVKEVREVCTSYAPSRVDYKLDDGSAVFNIISSGLSGAAGDLFITYMFEWKHDDIEEGSAAAKDAEDRHKKAAKIAVDTSIATTRKLVSEGQIQYR